MMQAVQTPARRMVRCAEVLHGQPALCWSLCVFACLLGAGIWRLDPPRIDHPFGVAILAASVPLAVEFSLPIRTGSGARLYFTGASILLIVVLLPPALAITVMGMGMGVKELMVCRRCQNTAWQMAGQVGRWMLIAAAATFLVHLTNVLAAGAVVGVLLWTCDILTAPLVFRARASLTRLYRNLFATTAREELMQYLTGALLVPVFILERQAPVIIVLMVSALAGFLFLFFLMANENERAAE